MLRCTDPGGATTKKKRKSMPRKTVKPDPRQEADDEEIADVWKVNTEEGEGPPGSGIMRGEDGETGQQDDSTTDFSNIDLISR